MKKHNILSKIFPMILIVLLLVGCGGKSSQIKKVTENFCNAVNHGDIYGALDYVNPTVVDVVRPILDLGGFFFDSDQDMFGALQVISDFLPDSEYEEIIDAMAECLNGSMEIEIELRDISVNEKLGRATANASITLKYDDEVDIEDTELYYTFIDGDWYISVRNFYD